MGIINIFGRKNKNKEEPQIKPTIARGPGGKFISQKKAEEQPSEDQVKATKKESPPRSKAVTESIPQVSVFYSHDIRKFYLDGEWYFSLIDMLPLAQITNPDEYLNKLKTDVAEEIFSEYCRPISYTKEDGKKETLECITYEGFMKLLPVIRSEGNLFPGPLPDWLKEMSVIPA